MNGFHGIDHIMCNTLFEENGMQAPGNECGCLVFYFSGEGNTLHCTRLLQCPASVKIKVFTQQKTNQSNCRPT